MAKYGSFNEWVEVYVKEKKPRLAKLLLKDGKIPIEIAFDILKEQGASGETIQKLEETAMKDGSMEMTYEGAKRIFQGYRKTIAEKGERDGIDYLKIFDHFDETIDHDLIANGIFCFVPEIREGLGSGIEGLYKVVLNIGAGEKKGYSVPQKQKVDYREDGYILPRELEDLISIIPKVETSENEEYLRELNIIVRRKVEREVFPLFKRDSDIAFSLIEEKIEQCENENLIEAYRTLRDTYRAYENIEPIGVNLDFRDPETGERDVLPSLHQRIAMYHLIQEKRFGIFDGCGTGKTAIPVLVQPMIERDLERQDRVFERVIIVAKKLKPWMEGLIGGDEERYLSEIQNAAFVHSGIKKDESFLEELRMRKWIVLTYPQLITRVSSTGRLFFEELIDLGADLAVFDESHHLKSIRKYTSRGIPSQSFASRLLANSSENVALLTGSPLPDRLEDYSVPFSIINPEICPDPEKFEEFHRSNPRIMYTFFNEKTVRRTSEDINEDLELESSEISVDLTSIQDKLYYHIVEFRPKNWLMQARKALLDPRLVDPEILKRAGVLGEVDYDSSGKYKRLRELLLSKEGPLENGEKFVIFSSMFRDGVTQPANGELRRRYIEVGVEEEFDEAFGLESRILATAVYEDNSLMGLRKKLSKFGGGSFDVEFSEAINSLVEKGYISLDEEAILLNTSEKGELNRYLGIFNNLGLHIPLPKKLEEILYEETGDKHEIGVIDGTVRDIEERESVGDRLKDRLTGVSCTTEAGGESLNFTSASYVYFLDDDYVPKTNEQGLARLLRKGQKRVVKVSYLRGKDTLDENLRDYVLKKEIVIKIALDGHPLTDEEKQLLEDTDGKLFSDLIKRGLGGRSINVFNADISSLGDFEVKRRIRRGVGGFYTGKGVVDYTTTEAQEVMNWIGRDKEGCWNDPEFVELYMRALSNLSIPVIHRAKICDLVNRASLGTINFPGSVLSEGSGPSLLYSAYQDLRSVMGHYGFEIPEIVDRDTSRLMLDMGNNPNQVLGDMRGRGSTFKDGEFDMVDNESITLLRSPEEVKDSLLEANRVLKPNGLIELVVKNSKFSDGFYPGMEGLGFELLTGKNEGFYVSKDMLRRLKESLGEHYAQAYANKLAQTCVLLGRKVDNPLRNISPDNFCFEDTVKLEEEGSNVILIPVSDRGDEYESVRSSRSGKTKEKRRRKALPGEIKGLDPRLQDGVEIEE
jgi:hypothetical protein